MEKQLRLKQIMLAASLMLSGVSHAMDSTREESEYTSNEPVIVNSDLIVEGSGSVEAVDILKPTPDVVEAPTLPTPKVLN